MGSIEKRIRDGRRTWLARWRDPAGRQRKRSFGRKVDADRFLTTVESSKHAGVYVDPGAGRQTVGQYAGAWLQRQGQLRPGTRQRYSEIIRVHILPAFGTVPLSRMERSAVSSWVARLSVTLAPATVRHVHRVLVAILNTAVADGRLTRNVAAGVPVPPAGGREKRFLSHEEVAALAAAAGDNGIVIRVLAYTGLRFGELAALRVCDVDPRRRRLTVARSVSEVNGRLIVGPPKSGRTRSVPIPRTIADELAVLCAGRTGEEPVFTSPSGGMLWLRNWRRRVFGPATRAAGLEGLTPHGLRHTAASLAVAAGADVKSVQRMLGHASAAMTLDVYSGLFEDHLDAVADRLDEAAAKARGVATDGAQATPEEP